LDTPRSVAAQGVSGVSLTEQALVVRVVALVHLVAIMATPASTLPPVAAHQAKVTQAQVPTIVRYQAVVVARAVLVATQALVVARTALPWAELVLLTQSPVRILVKFIITTDLVTWVVEAEQ
jgi:hypothetical protein